MSKHEMDRMDDEGGHLSHAERERVFKRRFHRAAEEFCRRASLGDSVELVDQVMQLQRVYEQYRDA